jgi:hypothetical protein
MSKVGLRKPPTGCFHVETVKRTACISYIVDPLSYKVSLAMSGTGNLHSNLFWLCDHHVAIHEYSRDTFGHTG